jgi:predicted nucleic acid-binding protein
LKTIIADSCSLILLSKCGLLCTLAELFHIIIPEAVFHEIANKDTLKKYPDAEDISNIISEKKINVIKINTGINTISLSLGKGESEALILSKQTADSILLTDGGKAIKACRYMKLPFIISPRVVLELYRLDKINFTKTKGSIEKLRIIGRYSPDIIAEAILKLEEIKYAKTNNSPG